MYKFWCNLRRQDRQKSGNQSPGKLSHSSKRSISCPQPADQQHNQNQIHHQSMSPSQQPPPPPPARPAPIIGNGVGPLMTPPGHPLVANGTVNMQAYNNNYSTRNEMDHSRMIQNEIYNTRQQYNSNGNNSICNNGTIQVNKQNTPNHYSTTPMSMMTSTSSSTPMSSNNNTSSYRDELSSNYMLAPPSTTLSVKAQTNGHYSNAHNGNNMTQNNNRYSMHNYPPQSNQNQVSPYASSGPSMETYDDLRASAAAIYGTINQNGGKMKTINTQQTNSSQQQFVRSTKARMSLPIMQHNRLRRQPIYAPVAADRDVHVPAMLHQRQASQSLGQVYLQHCGETKQANLPNELTAIDTIKALFVCAFPNLLTMDYMSQAYVKIYIYNPSCNIFYELRCIEDVKHESVLRVHHSDPSLMYSTQFQYPITAAATARMQPIAHQIPPPKPRRMVSVNNLSMASRVQY